MPDVVYNQTNPNNYIFDPVKLETVGGEFRLIPQVSGAAAALYTKLDENKGLVAIDSSGNSRHGAFQGGYTELNWTTGKINSAIVGISTTNGFINFDQLLAYERTEPFSLECWFNSTASLFMFLISKQGNIIQTGFAASLTLLGKMRFVIRDNIGNFIAVETASTYNDGDWHHVVITCDGSSTHTGLTIYIDNVIDTIVTTTGTLTSTITTTANLQISGRDGNNLCIDSNTKLDEVVMYSRELSAAEVAFRWNGGAGTQEIPGATTSFPTDNPTAPPADTFRAVAITSFDADITATGNDSVEFTYEINGTEYYVDGGTWAVSSGYPQTNDFATIHANVSTLFPGEIANRRYIPYFHSDTGDTTPTLNTVTTGYNIADATEEKVLCQVTFDQTKITGNPSIKEITVLPVPRVIQYKDTIIVREDIINLTIPENGLLVQGLLETESMTDPHGKIPQPYNTFIMGNVIFNKFIPALPAKNFWDLEDVY